MKKNEELAYEVDGLQIIVRSKKGDPRIKTYTTIVRNLFNRRVIMNDIKYDWKTEDYQRLMMSSSVPSGKSCQKPLIDTNQEKWNEKFDTNYKIQKEFNWIVINIATIIAGIAMIVLFNIY